MNRGYNAYKKTSVSTATKEQILLMLYQAAIKNCKKAIDSMEKGELAKKGEAIGKLQDIIIELNNSLDFDVGGKIAQELASLYDYLLFATTQANINKDVNQLKACLKIINTLYTGWTQAISSLKDKKPEERAATEKSPSNT